MFKKFLLVLSLIFVLIVSYAYSQEDMRYIDNSYFENPQRPKALFNHDEHNEKAGIDDCASCHHTYDESGNLIEGESSEGTACADCHSLKKEGSKPSLMNAFHSSCINCHKENSKVAPLACGECHKK